MIKVYSNKNRENGENLEDVSSEKSIEIMLIRTPIMSMLSVDSGKPLHFKSFRSPMSGHVPGVSEESRKMTLGCKIPRDSTFCSTLKRTSFKLTHKYDERVVKNDDSENISVNPLVLWNSQDESGNVIRKIEVDPMLTKWLREHQRQGVMFIFECLMGLRDFNGNGCILADDMGLGKTLQSITILWTLLNQGFDGKPSVRKAVVVCPASLVKNWSSEIDKWLQGKCKCTAVAEKDREKVISSFAGFKYDMASRILIASYETFRMHVEQLDDVPIDLVICDEAHRLKNDRTKTAISINNLPAKKRLLLSGTPIQNDLVEFYSLVSLANPQVLGDVTQFKKFYANPILEGREPDATEYQQELATQRLMELSNITNHFILRRANTLLAKVLPPKIILNVFCNLTPIQNYLYKKFLRSSTCKKILDSENSVSGVSNSSGLTGQVLSSIQSLMKLCNHPLLIRPKNNGTFGKGFEGCEKYFEMMHGKNYCSSSEYNSDCSGNANRRTAALATSLRNSRSGFNSKPNLSGKFYLLSRLLFHIRSSTKDRVVLVSNYTQTLDLFESLCRDLQVPCVRLDGSTSITRRHNLVKTFNDPNSNSFAFLLSSKAGGCGINLIGANRLVMFDPDWNPANDKQALARVWRDGQKKNCYIYRLFSTGTIEEKIYQRQLCKDGLSAMLVTSTGNNELKDSISADLVRDLFTLREDTISDTHDMIQCNRCYSDEGNILDMVPQTTGMEDELNTWGHYYSFSNVPDEILSVTLNECIGSNSGATEDEMTEKRKSNPFELPHNFSPVSFVMACRIELQSQSDENENNYKENTDMNVENGNKFSGITDNNNTENHKRDLSSTVVNVFGEKVPLDTGARRAESSENMYKMNDCSSSEKYEEDESEFSAEEYEEMEVDCDSTNSEMYD
ncbi:DNA repair protein RAD54-like [Cryptosporidium ryanae]|uniref:DNA repair protein RAD54-like n=1 Tax=Cryptosporidium ryanae TaxID=515981 RepID=UPI00351A609A|nr:DNA repair protein RAD54-like [Cryptosporidium ryanae]